MLGLSLCAELLADSVVASCPPEVPASRLLCRLYVMALLTYLIATCMVKTMVTSDIQSRLSAWGTSAPAQLGNSGKKPLVPNAAGLLKLFWHVCLAPEPAHEVVAQVLLAVGPQLCHSGMLSASALQRRLRLSLTTCLRLITARLQMMP